MYHQQTALHATFQLTFFTMIHVSLHAQMELSKVVFHAFLALQLAQLVKIHQHLVHRVQMVLICIIKRVHHHAHWERIKMSTNALLVIHYATVVSMETVVKLVQILSFLMDQDSV